VSYDSEPRLPVEVGSNAATYPAAPCGPRVSSIKKDLAVLPVQLGTHVPNAHTHVSKALDIRAIMGLQDVRTGSAAPALWTTRLAPLQCQATRQHGATLLTECSVAGDKTRRAHVVEDIICYSLPLVPYCIGFYLPRGHLSGLWSHCNCPTKL
jgi:hypothetical protein